MQFPITFKGAFEIHSTVNGKKNIYEGTTTKEFDLNQLAQLQKDLDSTDTFISKKTGELTLPGIGKSIELTHNDTGLKLKSTEIMFDLIFNPNNTEKQVHPVLSAIVEKVKNLYNNIKI